MKALYTQERMIRRNQHGRGGRAGPLASCYVNTASSAWASRKSAVSKPSVNQP